MQPALQRVVHHLVNNTRKYSVEWSGFNPRWEAVLKLDYLHFAPAVTTSIHIFVILYSYIGFRGIQPLDNQNSFEVKLKITFLSTSVGNYSFKSPLKKSIFFSFFSERFRHIFIKTIIAPSVSTYCITRNESKLLARAESKIAESVL